MTLQILQCLHICWNMTQLKVVSTELFEVKEGGFEVNGKFVKGSAERDPEQIWLG